MAKLKLVNIGASILLVCLSIASVALALSVFNEKSSFEFDNSQFEDEFSLPTSANHRIRRDVSNQSSRDDVYIKVSTKLRLWFSFSWPN